MKREMNILIALALFVSASTVSFAQDDELSEQDLQTLLEDEGAPTVEVSEGAAPEAAVEPEAVSEVIPETSVIEPGAQESVQLPPSDTVEVYDVEDLEDNKAVENRLEDTSETVPETLEPLNTETAEAPKTDADDLEALKEDMGEGDLKSLVEEAPAVVEETPKTETEAEPVPNLVEKADQGTDVFDVGREERDLLSVAQKIQGQISDNEWNEVATATKVESYTVVKNDWLFKISKRLFGSGFFYPKIWSLNSFITNPHFIEPGMVLSFTTGSSSMAPVVKLGSFTEDEINAAPGSKGTTNALDLANFGDEAKPKWIDEKAALAEQGVYFQYASEETMEDLTKAGADALNREYENYEPPRNEFEVVIPSNYDKTGFDSNSRIFYSFKEGFYLSTFVSTNIVQDFGVIEDGPDENIFFVKMDRAYVKFDESINALPGDKFSVYTSMGKAKHENSDREGYKYAIVAQIKLIRKIRDKWEVQFIEVSGTPQRGDRITVYTPKIQRVTRTYNSRLVEAGILSTYLPHQTLMGQGDVVYLDRGRADGVEMGNVFEVYGFKDRLTGKNITDQPTYKVGEMAVITLTDNFATALVIKSNRDFYVGDIAITKTKESHLREIRARDARLNGDNELLGGKALEELDVELNLENLNDDLLKKADSIQLTEDELAELERQEREKSVIKDSERDLKALERLENEIEHAESILNDAKLDEDKLLENQSLDEIEKNQGNIDQDSLDEIEENLGKRYIDEDLNTKENPFGLTEFDIEEIDELLNSEKNDDQR